MITVTNQKVAGFIPQWASFRGFSVLFDGPHSSLKDGQLAGDVDNNPELGFYRALRDTLAQLDLRMLTHTYLFCPLPAASYHVTVWDGANDGILHTIGPVQRKSIEQLLTDLPGALRQPHPLIQAIASSALLQRTDWQIEFQFSHLQLVSQNVLVAELAPANAQTIMQLQELVAARSALSETIQASYGFSPYERYWPHVSLGYFANQESAQLAAPCVALWNALLQEQLAEQRLAFNQASIYGFTDMATFFKD